MKLYAHNETIVNIGIWGRKNGSEGTYMPRQAEIAKETFDIYIDNEKVTVFYNTSKTHVPYYYLLVKGLWHWTCNNNIRTNSQYKTSQ